MSLNAFVTYNGKKFDLLSTKVNSSDQNKTIDDLIEAFTILKKETFEFFEKTQAGEKYYHSLILYFYFRSG